MQDLIKQEQFEIEVLDRLKSGRLRQNSQSPIVNTQTLRLW